MQSVAVEMGCSLVTWNKHLNLWITRFKLFDKNRQQLHQRCIFLYPYLILSKNFVYTHVCEHAQFCAFWKHVGVWLTGHTSFWGSCLLLTLFFFISFPFWSWLQEQMVTNDTENDKVGEFLFIVQKKLTFFLSSADLIWIRNAPLKKVSPEK